MKITKIEKVPDSYSKYAVTIEYNFLERLFGCKSGVQVFKQTDYQYTFGDGGWVFMNENGEFLSNGNKIEKAINQWRRKQNW